MFSCPYCGNENNFYANRGETIRRTDYPDEIILKVQCEVCKKYSMAVLVNKEILVNNRKDEKK